jgi:hypothetical protein
MTQHYTKNTIEASAWCKICVKPTPHAVNDGRIGSCLTCITRLNLQHDLPGIERAKEPVQMELMERYGAIDIG